MKPLILHNIILLESFNTIYLTAIPVHIDKLLGLRNEMSAYFLRKIQSSKALK